MINTRSKSVRRATGALAVFGAAALGTAVATAPPATAQAGHQSVAAAWAPAATAAIHPGTMMYTDASANVYVGYAAHCAGTGSSTDTNGCNTDSVPLGTKVDFTNDGNLASEGTIVGHGTLVYSSWITAHKLGTTDPT